VLIRLQHVGGHDNERRIFSVSSRRDLSGRPRTRKICNSIRALEGKLGIVMSHEVGVCFTALRIEGIIFEGVGMVLNSECIEHGPYFSLNPFESTNIL